MPRNDTNYVCLRVTDEERKAYEAKLKKTRFSAKRFLLKLLHDEKLRESPPKTELEVRHDSDNLIDGYVCSAAGKEE